MSLKQSQNSQKIILLIILIKKEMNLIYFQKKIKVIWLLKKREIRIIMQLNNNIDRDNQGVQA